MEQQEVGGILSDMLTKFLKDYVLALKPDWKKLNVPKNKQGFGDWIDSLKDIVPGTIDDMVLDMVKKGYNELIDHLTGPPTFGDPIYTAADAVAFLATLPGSVNAECAAKIEQYPQIIAALKKLSPEKALKVANNSSVLDRLIQILLDWGPLFLKIAMIILPFFI